MHYIVGTQIIFKKVPPRPGISSRDIHIPKPPSGFLYNVIYTLRNIAMNNSRYIYTFRTPTTGDIAIEFDSIKRGDEFISNTRQELLPDYNEMYSRNTG